MFRKPHPNSGLWGFERFDGMQGVCSAAVPDPVKVSVTVLRRYSGCCAWLPLYKEKKRVVRFSYKGHVFRPYVSYALMDLGQLIRTCVSGGAQVRFTLKLQDGERRVAHADCDHFCILLKKSSSNMSFSLHVDEEKVTLLKAGQLTAEVIGEWPYEYVKHGHRRCLRQRKQAPYKRQGQDKNDIGQGLATAAQDPGNAEKKEDSDEESRWEAHDEGMVKESDGSADVSGYEGDDEGPEEEGDEASDVSSWDTFEEDTEEGAGRGPAGGSGRASGGRFSFLERLGAAWQYSGPALLLLGTAAMVATAVWWSPIGGNHDGIIFS